MTEQGTHCGRKNVDERFIYTVEFSPFARNQRFVPPPNADWNKTRIYHYGLVIGLPEIHHKLQLLQLQGPYDKKLPYSHGITPKIRMTSSPHHYKVAMYLCGRRIIIQKGMGRKKERPLIHRVLRWLFVACVLPLGPPLPSKSRARNKKTLLSGGNPSTKWVKCR